MFTRSLDKHESPWFILCKTVQVNCYGQLDDKLKSTRLTVNSYDTEISEIFWGVPQLLNHGILTCKWPWLTFNVCSTIRWYFCAAGLNLQWLSKLYSTVYKNIQFGWLSLTSRDVRLLRKRKTQINIEKCLYRADTDIIVVLKIYFSIRFLACAISDGYISRWIRFNIHLTYIQTFY